jgi:uncharacterized protein YfaS (alpha-2-macroglobulin family)
VPFISIVLTILSFFPVPGSTFFAMAGAATSPAPAAGGYESLKRQAEGAYEEKSYQRAHDFYEQAAKLELTAADRRWVTFRLADTAWRVDAADASPDQDKRDTARKELEKLINESGEEHDRVWAEANESLADEWWLHPQLHNYGTAQPFYLAALDWWSGSGEVEVARRRYLAMVFRLAAVGRYGGRWQGEAMENASVVPHDVLVNALAIATEPQDRAHARFLLGTQLLAERRPESVERGLELLDGVIGEGKGTPWYDDALFAYAQQLSDQGRVIVLESGDPGFQHDYAKAVELFQRLLALGAEETRFYDQAKQRVNDILQPSVSAIVPGNFLPGSEQEVIVPWRNVREVELTVTAVDLTRDVDPALSHRVGWAQAIKTEGRPVIRRWKVSTSDTGDHTPGVERVRMRPPLAGGAYVITAAGGEKTAHQLFLISDLNVLTHALNGKTAVFVSNVMTGEPVAGASVRLWQQDGSLDVVRDAVTNAAGLAVISEARGYGTTVVAASSGAARQAYVSTYSYTSAQSENERWRIYAFTDRSAYRPGDTVHWKMTARVREESRWTTPAHAKVQYEIISPQDEKVASGEAVLNEFGSFWADLPLTATMPLGGYEIVFRTLADKNQAIGSAPLFALEEYKLPELRVSVTTPEEGGKRKLYRLGDKVEATIEASYYFGGPVANATVEAVVSSQPFYRDWFPWREYDWYYDDDRQRHWQSGTEVKRETLHTDAQGRAVVQLETPRDGNEMQYTIVARVVDASRREVEGSGTVNVLRQRYSVLAHPAHYLYLPGQQASIDFRAVDANEQPVQTSGTVTVLRRVWQEIWLDPAGREVTGRELERARAADSDFPPPPPAIGVTWWRTKTAGYRDEEVLTAKVSTDAKGEATVTFTPPREGYYVASWRSEDRDPGRPVRARDIVSAETAVWVTQTSTIELGYHTGGLQIIVEKDELRAGRKAQAMIVTPASNRWVLLSASSDTLLDTRVVHLDGTVKLVQLQLDERYSPSFSLTASSIFNRVLATETRRVVVPPVEHFINVEVKPDREQYEPRGEGKITVTTRDVDGKPVPAEVALSVSDQSVTAIRAELNGDPRQFFYEDSRGGALSVAASVQSQRYLRYIEDAQGRLTDERRMESGKTESKDERDGMQFDSLVGGVMGGMVAMAPPPPPAVSESIMVTAEAPMVMAAKSSSAANVANAVTAPVGGIEVQVRSDFRATALWKPDLTTGPDGSATVTLKYPETLTTWLTTARAASAGADFGSGSTTVRTNLPLLVRLESPRFFVAGDRAVVSAVINNNSDAPLSVTPALEVEGLTLSGRMVEGKPVSGAMTALNVPAHGEARADWTVVAEHAGPAKLRVSGKSATRGDAMEKSFTVYEHGVEKLIAHSGKLRGDEATVKLDLPAARRGTQLTVQIAPSLAVTMLDALPYLIDYPYGCTEQTMSRFLPAAIVAKTLTANGLDAGDIEGKLFGGIETSHTAATHPGGKKGLEKLDAVTAASMARLYDFQHEDGGWGWWKEGEGDLYMTAYVVWGFSVARAGGLNVDEKAVDRAVTWLDQHLAGSEGNHQIESWALHAIAAWRAGGSKSALSKPERTAFDDAWSHRERLSAYSRALLALAAHDAGEEERARVLVRNLEDGVKIDRAPDQSVLLKSTIGTPAEETMATAHWGASGSWWQWWESPVESTSFALQALVKIDPTNRLIEPAMNWLVKNRRGAQWNNTRDTAIALLSLNDYLATSHELAGGVTYELTVNGGVIATKTITAASALGAPTRFVIDPSLIRDHNEVRIRRIDTERAKAARGPLYFAAEARFLSLEEPVTAAGSELFVRRDYFRLAPKPTLLKGVVYETVPLRDHGTIDSGDRVEVVVTIETKNDYEYLLLEDLKPAGFEAVELESGEPLYAVELRSRAVNRKFVGSADGEGKPLPPGEDPSSVRVSGSDDTGRTAWVYQELRDRKVALFIDHLPQGIWEIRYPLRAETPGAFHALPLLGQAMYVPEIRGNSDEVRVEVRER